MSRRSSINYLCKCVRISRTFVFRVRKIFGWRMRMRMSIDGSVEIMNVWKIFTDCGVGPEFSIWDRFITSLCLVIYNMILHCYWSMQVYIYIYTIVVRTYQLVFLYHLPRYFGIVSKVFGTVIRLAYEDLIYIDLKALHFTWACLQLRNVGLTDYLPIGLQSVLWKGYMILFNPEYFWHDFGTMWKIL